MAKMVDKLAREIHGLADGEKLRLVDVILADLDKPDPEIDKVWAAEARKRWSAYKTGRVRSVGPARGRVPGILRGDRRRLAAVPAGPIPIRIHLRCRW